MDRHQQTLLQTLRVGATLFFAYFLIAYFLHGLNQNLYWNLLGGGDGYTAGLPSKIFAASLSAWNPYVQLGQYTFANTQFQPFYPPGLLLMGLFPNTLGYNLFILLHYVLAGLFFYLFANNLGLGRCASFMGGITFLSSGFLLSHKGHQAMMSTAVWLPLVLYFCDRYASEWRLKYMALGGTALAVSILGGFPQVTVYSLLLIVPYIVFRCLSRPGYSRVAEIRAASLGILVMGALAGLLASLQLTSVAEALPHITRQQISLEMFNEDALPAVHLLALFIPNIMGGYHGTPTYSTNGNVVEVYPYMGLLTLAMALLGFRCLRRTRSDVWFWAVALLASAVLSLGLQPVQYLLYRVPVYNLFRAPTRHLFEVNFALSVLAALGADVLLTRERFDAVVRSGVRWSCMVLALAFAGVLLLSQLVRFVAVLALKPEYVHLRDIRVAAGLSIGGIGPQVIRILKWTSPTILYPLIALGAVLAVLLAFRTLPRRFAILILSSVLLVDVASVYRTIYDNPDTQNLYPGPQLRQEVPFLLKNQAFDPDHYRILPAEPSVVHTYPLLNMMYGLSAINDYTPMWLKRYQAMTDFPLNGAASFELLSRQKILSALSVQYILTRDPKIALRLRNTRSSISDRAVTRLPLPEINCPALNCVLTKFPQPGILQLQSPDGRAVSIVHFSVSLKQETFYRVEFDARSLAEGQDAKRLFVDLYSVQPGKPPYDDTEQDQTVEVSDNGFMRYRVLINSGAAAPPTASLRIYTLSKVPIDVRPVGIGVAGEAPSRAYIDVGRTQSGLVIFKNPDAVPRFRFATDLLPSRGVADVRQRLQADSTFDVLRQVTVEGLSTRQTVAPGRIISEGISNNELRWKVESGALSFFVVNDSWFPGWTATVDGRSTEIHVVNGCVRGIFIKGNGTHDIEMRFWPKSLSIGITTTIVGLIILAAMLVRRDTGIIL